MPLDARMAAADAAIRRQSDIDALLAAKRHTLARERDLPPRVRPAQDCQLDLSNQQLARPLPPE
eukprot:259423-Prymnesium_polylepis.2